MSDVTVKHFIHDKEQLKRWKKFFITILDRITCDQASFHPVLTDEGLCCAFNTVESKQMFKNASDHVYTAPKSNKYVAVPWTPESGYPKALPNDYYPAAAIGTGYSMGLTVILNAEIAEYYCSSTNGAGFKFLLHSPIETAEVGDNGFSLQVGHETRAVISPIVSEATDTIRDLSQRDRQCLFNSEIDLSYFKTYSQRNCELECEARQIAERCKCIMHYMPRVIPEIAICSVRDMPCVQAADGKAQIANQNGNNCSQDCIAACFDITYYVKTFSAPILRGAFALKHNALQRVPRDYAEKNLAVAHFYYTYNSFRSRVRQQYVGFTDVLSNTGGLMGLFVGFSVISVVEVLYYGTLRPYCVSRKESSQAEHTPAVKTRMLQIKRRKFWAHNISNPAVRNEILKSNGWQK
ncbi:pickpocket protein 28-like [Hermetia illucens]|uniref:pickpocket protein 28-like n=1 Tax=Hermetia illucens TaxID=343691 RepID=UPI0018CC0631|nr:pickpocket protein 28-like [Hermetia illucens]